MITKSRPNQTATGIKTATGITAAVWRNLFDETEPVRLITEVLHARPLDA